MRQLKSIKEVVSLKSGGQMKTSIENRELKVFEWSSDEVRTTTAKLCNMICLKCRPYEKLPLVFEPNLEIQKW